MKTSFKTLSFIIFIPFLLLISPLHVYSKDDVSTQTKDIQILIDNEVNNVSSGDIKERLLNGEPVHFVEGQDEVKRKIRKEWVLEAIRNDKDIDVENTIIDEDLDVKLEDKLVKVKNADLETDIKERLEIFNVEQIFLIKSKISIKNSAVRKDFIVAYCGNLNATVVFQNDINFSGSKFSGKKTNFGSATFSGKETDFRYATFSGEETSFNKAEFNDEIIEFTDCTFRDVDFSNARMKKLYSWRTHFNGFLNINYTIYDKLYLFWDQLLFKTKNGKDYCALDGYLYEKNKGLFNSLIILDDLKKNNGDENKINDFHKKRQRRGYGNLQITELSQEKRGQVSP